MSLLQAEGIVAGYDPGLPIVRGASLHVAAGEIVAVLGPNGAGKSTLVKALAGVVAMASGAVRLAGADLTDTPAHKRLAAGLAFTPQTENVFAAMSVADNLRIAADALPAPDRRRRIEAMYAAFPDLARQRGLLAGRLSGGQRQMLAIARALIVGPRALMLDEPSAGLSPKFVEDVFARLVEIARGGVAVLLVEQNTRAALAVADRAYVLAQGRNRYEGDARQLAGPGVLAALFLGQAQ